MGRNGCCWAQAQTINYRKYSKNCRKWLRIGSATRSIKAKINNFLSKILTFSTGSWTGLSACSGNWCEQSRSSVVQMSTNSRKYKGKRAPAAGDRNFRAQTLSCHCDQQISRAVSMFINTSCTNRHTCTAWTLFVCMETVDRGREIASLNEYESGADGLSFPVTGGLFNNLSSRSYAVSKIWPAVTVMCQRLWWRSSLQHHWLHNIPIFQQSQGHVKAPYAPFFLSPEDPLV